MRGWDVVWLVKCLPGMCKALDLISNMESNQVAWHNKVMPALRRWRGEDQEFEVIVGSLLSLGAAWTTGDSVYKRKGGYWDSSRSISNNFRLLLTLT